MKAVLEIDKNNPERTTDCTIQKKKSDKMSQRCNSQTPQGICIRILMCGREAHPTAGATSDVESGRAAPPPVGMSGLS